MKRGRKFRALFALSFASTLCWMSCSDRSQLSTVVGNPPMVIEPNLCVGQVRAGMNVQDVLTKLGEPQRRTANALEYTRLGFAVMPDPEGIIQVVMCGDVTGINGPLVKAFTGHTKEGIGLGSIRDDLVKAYGQPSSSEIFPGGTESIRYDSLGMTFTLEGGKIYHMIVRFTKQQDPERTVTLEPLPGTTQR